MMTDARLDAIHITSFGDCAGAHEDICFEMASRVALVPLSAASICAKALVTAARHAGEPPAMGSLRDAATTSLYPAAHMRVWGEG